MLADNFIERGTLKLKNMNKNGATLDTWSSGSSSYGFYNIYYTDALLINHYYYIRATYKYTTTNQSPTWCAIYLQGGMANSNYFVSNPVAGTEYTASLLATPKVAGISYTMSTGQLYNGNSNAISGVTAYAKNVMAYDITDLYDILLANGTVTSTSTMKTWCDNNLTYVKGGEYLDVTSLAFPSTSSKVQFKNGTAIVNEMIEPDGMNYYSYSSTLANNCWFDSSSGLSVYNNNGNGTVTHTRVSAKDQGSPFSTEHPYVLKIVTNGSASPYAGGFQAYHLSSANKVFIEKFVAKVPVGYNVTCHYNSQGSGASVKFLTSQAGTGDWEEYAVLYRCGSSGTFSTGGHIALSGSNNTSVTWYLAYVNNCDITGKEYLMNYSILPKKSSFKGGYIFSKSFDNVNLLTNGDCSDQSSAMLPSGWSYDTTDYAGSAKCSLVQPVNAGTGTFGGLMAIDPYCQYKFSMWVKCKGDMTSFLTYLLFYTSPTSGALTHTYQIYVPGTKTKLTATLNTGDTQMTVASNANWKARSYSRVGFRSNYYSSSWQDKGVSNVYNNSTGLISGTSGSTIVTFNTAYTGSTMASGTCVVEAYDGGVYPYPFGKGNLPTDNTWKYLETTFGTNNSMWDGSSSGGWVTIPSGARYMKFGLNLYTNTGSVPIKYSDIRITPVIRDNGRMENKIAFKHYS